METGTLPPLSRSPTETKEKETEKESVLNCNEESSELKELDKDQKSINLPQLVEKSNENLPLQDFSAESTPSSIGLTTNSKIDTAPPTTNSEQILKDNDTFSNPQASKNVISEGISAPKGKKKKVEVIETKVKKKGNSKVFVRIRPIVRDGGGHDQNGPGVVKALDSWDETSVTINTAYMFSEGSQQYNFPEKVLGPEVDQETMYNTMLPEYISSFTEADGHNVVFLAYGQTGTGKTHTMFGTDESLKVLNDENNAISIHKDWGILPRTVASTLQILNTQSTFTFVLVASAVEFYLGQCYDLLHDHNVLDIDIDTARPLGMAFTQIKNLKHLLQFIARVKQMRTSCNTKMNQASNTHEGSSRSHCALILQLFTLEKATSNVYQSSFTILDLAGAERPSKVGVSERKTKNDVSSGASPSSSSSKTTSTSSSSTESSLMLLWSIEGERQRGNDEVALQHRAQANQPDYLALQAQVINYELQEMRTLILSASTKHKKKKNILHQHMVLKHVVLFHLLWMVAVAPE